MSAHPLSRSSFTADGYLAWEAGQLERHEFIDGDVFAMAGAEDRHVTVCLNLAMALRQHLRGTPCRTFMSDMKLQVDAANSYFYPDILVFQWRHMPAHGGLAQAQRPGGVQQAAVLVGGKK